MVRKGLTADIVVGVAMGILDRDGPAALTLAAVAAESGVSTPSLYKHVASLADLRTLVGLRILHELTAAFTEAVLGRSGDDAVRALMHAYRDYARKYPARYAAMPADPLHDPILADTAGQLMTVLVAVLRGYGLPEHELIHAVRRLRSVAHGFASLETAGGFGLPEDLDETYAQLIDMTLTSL